MVNKIVMIRCPHCGSEQVGKNGHNKSGKQVYLCKNPACQYHSFVEEYTYKACEPAVRQQVLKLAHTNYQWLYYNPFFINDYQFNRMWADPDRYLQMLRCFQCVCTPDFSTYTDFPKAVQIFNHYRKHWLSAYCQENGIAVIPTISWSDKDSFARCFDVEPAGGTVAISSVGTQINPECECAQLFELGVQEMVRRLQPSQIVMYGSVPDVCLECGIGISAVKPILQQTAEIDGSNCPAHPPERSFHCAAGFEAAGWIATQTERAKTILKNI